MRNHRTFGWMGIMGIALALLAAATVAGAQAPVPAVGERFTAEGVLVGIVTLPASNGAEARLRMSIREDDGAQLTIQACSAFWSEDKPILFNLGDRIRAIGTMTEMDGMPMLSSCDIRLVVSPQPPQASAPPYAYPTPDYGTLEPYPNQVYAPNMIYPSYGFGLGLYYPWWRFGLRGRFGNFDADHFRGRHFDRDARFHRQFEHHDGGGPGHRIGTVKPSMPVSPTPHTWSHSVAPTAPRTWSHGVAPTMPRTRSHSVAPTMPRTWSHSVAPTMPRTWSHSVAPMAPRTGTASVARSYTWHASPGPRAMPSGPRGLSRGGGMRGRR